VASGAISSHAIKEMAATSIQASFRGFKTRKMLAAKSSGLTAGQRKPATASLRADSGSQAASTTTSRTSKLVSASAAASTASSASATGQKKTAPGTPTQESRGTTEVGEEIAVAGNRHEEEKARKIQRQR